MRSLAIPAAALVAGVALSACGSTRATPKVGERLRTANFPQYPLSFRYPAAWNRRDCQYPFSSFTDTVTYLTTARPGACHQSGVSIKRLSKNGVLVVWGDFGMPGWDRITRFPGRDTTIGGRAARIETSSGRVPYCRRFGATRSMTVTIKRAGRDNWMTAFACLSGPNFRRSEEAVRQMLSTVRLD